MTITRTCCYTSLKHTVFFYLLPATLLLVMKYGTQKGREILELVEGMHATSGEGGHLLLGGGERLPLLRRCRAPTKL